MEIYPVLLQFSPSYVSRDFMLALDEYYKLDLILSSLVLGLVQWKPRPPASFRLLLLPYL